MYIQSRGGKMFVLTTRSNKSAIECPGTYPTFTLLSVLGPTLLSGKQQPKCYNMSHVSISVMSSIYLPCFPGSSSLRTW